MKKIITLSALLLSAIVLAWCTAKPTTETPITQESESTMTGYSIEEVAAHATQSDCWTSINGNVYDITSAFGKHKWWDEKLLWLCGIEWTEKFEKQHWDNEKAKWRLATLQIWVLE